MRAFRDAPPHTPVILSVEKYLDAGDPLANARFLPKFVET